MSRAKIRSIAPPDGILRETPTDRRQEERRGNARRCASAYIGVNHSGQMPGGQRPVFLRSVDREGSVAMTHDPLTVSDAANILRGAQETAPAFVDVNEVLRAGLALLARTQVMEGELERARARTSGLHTTTGQDQISVEGHALVEREQAGGARHFLADRPVHAGTGLYLLTYRGWYEGRYEWSFRRPDPPRFYFSLPGVRDEFAIPIPVTARLAWPDELSAP